MNSIDIVSPLTRLSEGLRLIAYQDTGGVWTIGYGHTRGVRKGDRVTRAGAEHFLFQDLLDARADVRRLVKVSLTANQEAALIDFVFNLGATALAGSTLLRKLNKGDYDAIPRELRRWVYGSVNGKKVVLRGLEIRRDREAELWVTP